MNAEALESPGKWDDAMSEYRTVLEKDPNAPGIHFLISRLILSKPEAQSSLGDAQKEFEAELKIDPNNAGAEYVLGEIARQHEQWPQAIEHFQHAPSLDHGKADAFIVLGRSLIAGGKDAEAIAPLEHAVQLQPANPTGHFHLAAALRHAGKKEQADGEMSLYREATRRAGDLRRSVHEGVLGPQQADAPAPSSPR